MVRESKEFGYETVIHFLCISLNICLEGLKDQSHAEKSTQLTFGRGQQPYPPDESLQQVLPSGHLD